MLAAHLLTSKSEKKRVPSGLLDETINLIVVLKIPLLSNWLDAMSPNRRVLTIFELVHVNMSRSIFRNFAQNGTSVFPNLWAVEKKWEIFSLSERQLQNRLIVYKKLCINIWLRRWLRPSRNIVNIFSPWGLWGVGT